jgi:hypothetical protein
LPRAQRHGPKGEVGNYLAIRRLAVRGSTVVLALNLVGDALRDALDPRAGTR